MNRINKNISMFFQEFGSLNLEMAIIIGVFVIAAVAGLATTGGKLIILLLPLLIMLKSLLLQ